MPLTKFKVAKFLTGEISTGRLLVCTWSVALTRTQGSNMVSAPKKSIQLAGAKVHRIIANVCSFEWAARRADVRLTALPEPSPIFTAKDLGVRLINVSMHDDLSCWLSTQAMAFGEPIAMNLVINANLDARGIIYNAKLVDFPDADKTSEKFRIMFAQRISSLFD